ncbi:hypothetical protein CROQUDRAFT_100781 [Cronartium quercuum f. sp. fusiforme G11]|uniref:Uncharacterized protein n=1 Tax=Cronartium quercuum f. sp. fusiforme G11 TaxID=708437 RepID=A0A9P6T5G8_9BASI|nr:hypothetical protein CROQUDRAFT_101779 [Cronartium quercuum f. sp. fusiforme G11]KAG0139962.1 hypothetical protein CROQUDRAFT_100781 [Cronartium quercuum f. sp. fusiforme G11]
MVSDSISGRRLRSPPSRLFCANLEPSMPSVNFKPSMGYVRVVGPLVAGRSTIGPSCAHQVNRWKSTLRSKEVYHSREIELLHPCQLVIQLLQSLMARKSQIGLQIASGSSDA